MRMNMMDKKKRKETKTKLKLKSRKSQNRGKNEALYDERRNDDSIYSSIWMIYFK